MCGGHGLMAPMGNPPMHQHLYYAIKLSSTELLLLNLNAQFKLKGDTYTTLTMR